MKVRLSAVGQKTAQRFLRFYIEIKEHQPGSRIFTVYYERWSTEEFLSFIHYPGNRDLHAGIDRQLDAHRVDKHASEAEVTALTDYPCLIVVSYYHVRYHRFSSLAPMFHFSLLPQEIEESLVILTGSASHWQWTTNTGGEPLNNLFRQMAGLA